MEIHVFPTKEEGGIGTIQPINASVNRKVYKPLIFSPFQSKVCTIISFQSISKVRLRTTPHFSGRKYRCSFSTVNTWVLLGTHFCSLVLNDCWYRLSFFCTYAHIFPYCFCGICGRHWLLPLILWLHCKNFMANRKSMPSSPRKKGNWLLF